MRDTLRLRPAASDAIEAPRLLLTAKQAAAALAVSPRTLWELTARGELPALRLPGRGKARMLRYAVDDLKAWIARTKANAAQRNGQPV
jgi:excisionase family DNA binding protein